MDSVKEIALLFVAAAVMSGAMGLFSGGTMTKSLRYITAVILLAALVTGLIRSDWEFSAEKQSINEGRADITEISLCEYQAEYMIKDIFNKNFVEYKEVSARATKTEEDSIIINEIMVEGADNKEKAVSLLASFGIDCRVVFR